MKVSDRWKIIFLSKREANSFLDGSFFFFFHGEKMLRNGKMFPRTESSHVVPLWQGKHGSTVENAREDDKCREFANTHPRHFFILEETTKTTDKDPFSSSFYEQINFSLWIELDPVPIQYINPWYSALT